MNVILLDKVENLGAIGDLVSVKSGYGRNYLIPAGKAALATAENIKDLDVLINKSISEFKNKDIIKKNFIDNNFYNNGSTIKSFNELISKGF